MQSDGATAASNWIIPNFITLPSQLLLYSNSNVAFAVNSRSQIYQHQPVQS